MMSRQEECDALTDALVKIRKLESQFSVTHLPPEECCTAEMVHDYWRGSEATLGVKLDYGARVLCRTCKTAWIVAANDSGGFGWIKEA
jgi:hypothetical protein